MVACVIVQCSRHEKKIKYRAVSSTLERINDDEKEVVS